MFIPSHATNTVTCRFMHVLVQHMSANGDHLSAESFEWSVRLVCNTFSYSLTLPVAVTLMLPPPQPHRWGSRRLRQCPRNLHLKPNCTMTPKANRLRMRKGKGLKSTTTSVARTCDQPVSVTLSCRKRTLIAH